MEPPLAIPATPSKKNEKAENKKLIQLRKSLSDMRNKLHKSQMKSSSLQSELHNLRSLVLEEKKKSQGWPVTRRI